MECFTRVYEEVESGFTVSVVPEVWIVTSAALHGSTERVVPDDHHVAFDDEAAADDGSAVREEREGLTTNTI